MRASCLALTSHATATLNPTQRLARRYLRRHGPQHLAYHQPQCGGLGRGQTPAFLGCPEERGECLHAVAAAQGARPLVQCLPHMAIAFGGRHTCGHYRVPWGAGRSLWASVRWQSTSRRALLTVTWSPSLV